MDLCFALLWKAFTIKMILTLGSLTHINQIWNSNFSEPFRAKLRLELLKNIFREYCKFSTVNSKFCWVFPLLTHQASSLATTRFWWGAFCDKTKTTSQLTFVPTLKVSRNSELSSSQVRNILWTICSRIFHLELLVK